jgi:type IV pilus assembly protein PilY1
MPISLVIKKAPNDPVSQSFTPGSYADDGSWSQGGSNYWNNRDQLFADTSYSSWVRFPNVTVPQGATITEAYVELYVLEDSVSNQNVYIRVVNEDNPSAPSNNTQAKTIFGRSLPANNWPTNSFSSGSTAQSVDFASDIQTVVNRAGWTSGNAIMISLAGNPAYVWFATYENSSGYLDPTLHLSWIA